MRTVIAIAASFVFVGLLLAGGCGDGDGVAPIARVAPSQPALSFDEQAATTANGAYPSATGEAVCGSGSRTFLAELAKGSPFDYKVPKRLADINPAPSQVMISGVATSAGLYDGDFPFDHTFGSDFNMDVEVDAPYTQAAQRNGVVEGTLHVELAEGQLPHAPSPPGPASGQTWPEMSAQSREAIYHDFVPETGNRVLVTGHWIVDCGHGNYETELHPLTFMATAREKNGKTVVHAFYNPYRETELFHPDPAKAAAFDDDGRLADPDTASFPAGLIASVLRLQDKGPAPYRSIPSLQSWALLEATQVSPVEWRVCAPAGSSGAQLEVQYHWITRPGVQIEVIPDDESSCATVRSTLGASTPAPLTTRVCTTPWDFLNQAAIGETGISDLDLKSQIRGFVSPRYRPRIDIDPVTNCYDPLHGPAVEAEPTGQRIEVREDVWHPFYGSISVTRRGR